ncbi:ATP-grasp domain-containing protein [Derxia gummosa]|uniref:ATP-grasp domain-containing protein n=1 Tax=Derxia gummosa DSM 723 TaxID=1121388 RepID=A0A8B6X9C0_9BURK|nr:ATP-grasp domain-containing protein [Derxia gummosa]
MAFCKRVFVYEFVSGGGCDALADPGELDALIPLGLWMRDALAADVASLGGIELSIATRARPGPGHVDRPLPGASHVAPRAGESAAEFVARQSRLHDATLLVAPETGGVLAELAEAVGEAAWTGCAPAVIRRVSDKRRLARELNTRGIAATVGMLAGEPLPSGLAAAGRWIVKPNDGAGALDTRVFDNLAAAQANLAARTAPATLEAWVTGEPISLSLLVTEAGVELLAVNRQHIGIDADGRLDFERVEIDAIEAGTPAHAACARLAARVAGALPGLFGFVGIDAVLTPSGEPVLIEVNPRVTCAYGGMSRVLRRNLAGAILLAHARRRAPLADRAGQAEDELEFAGTQP